MLFLPTFKHVKLCVEIKVISRFMEVKEKSSHYGLKMLGYTCATRVDTVRYDSEN